MGEINANLKNSSGVNNGAAVGFGSGVIYEKSKSAFETAKVLGGACTELLLLNAEDAVKSVAEKFGVCGEKSGDVCVITSDFGYFAVAREVKNALSSSGFNCVMFSADDGEISSFAINEFLNSVENPRFALIIGAEELYIAAASGLKKSKVSAVYIPTDCEIGRVFRDKLENGVFLEPEYLVIDENLISRLLNKHKAYSACCAVESSRLVRFELAACEELFCGDRAVLAGERGDFSSEDFRDMLEKTRASLDFAQGLLNYYYDGKNVASLTLAGAVFELSARACRIANAAAAFASLMQRGGRCAFCMRGELELYSAEALFLIYELLLSNGFYDSYSPSFSPADVFFRTERLKNDGYFGYSDISANIPSFIFERETVDKAIKSLISSDKVKSALAKLKNGLTYCRNNLNSVYGGKKRSVREYSVKNRATALFLTPLAAKDFCVLKLAYAAGLVEGV